MNNAAPRAPRTELEAHALQQPRLQQAADESQPHQLLRVLVGVKCTSHTDLHNIQCRIYTSSCGVHMQQAQHTALNKGRAGYNRHFSY